jgi:hypothetical protein
METAVAVPIAILPKISGHSRSEARPASSEARNYPSGPRTSTKSPTAKASAAKAGAAKTAVSLCHRA